MFLSIAISHTYHMLTLFMKVQQFAAKLLNPRHLGGVAQEQLQ